MIIQVSYIDSDRPFLYDCNSAPGFLIGLLTGVVSMFKFGGALSERLAPHHYTSLSRHHFLAVDKLQVSGTS